MKRHITTLALSAALALAPLSAMAADAQQADLAPGPAAGVQNAQGMGNNWLIYAGVAAAVAVVIIVASSGGSNGHGSSSTTTTGAP